MSQKLFQVYAFFKHRLFCRDAARLALDWKIKLWRISEQGYADRILEYRQVLENSRDIIQRTDFGTGPNKAVTVSSLAKSSSISKAYGEVLHSLVRNRQPSEILELGTCLGVSTLYMKTAQELNGRILTIEGCPNTYIARQKHLNSSFLNQQQIDFRRFEFSEFFNTLVDERFDMVFVDGNHQYAATLNYFEILKARMNPNGVIIFDDIHWSKGMEKAWNEIRKDGVVKASYDLFQFGIVRI